MTNDIRPTGADDSSMRELCHPDNESHEDSIRIALEGAGIHGVYRSGVAFDSGARVYVAQRDYDRAKQVIAGLQSTSMFNGPENRNVRIFRWVFALVVAGFVVREIWIMVSR